MKVIVEALVIRDKRTNEIVSIDIIRDMYSELFVEYTKDLVTPNEIKKYVDSYMGKNSILGEKAYKAIDENGIWGDSREAQDFSNVGNMIIGIESKEIDW